MLLGKKSQVKTYYIKVNTFRRTLELRVWWDKDYFDKEYSELGFDYDLTSWFYYFDAENNCNIIWMRKYDLSTLVHELVHCVEWMADQVWLEMKWEPIAFIYEEMFWRIWKKCWNKFRIDKDTEKFL